MLNNFFCAIAALAAIAVIVAEVRSDEYDRIPTYSGAQPGAACDYDYEFELDNTLPPTYAE